MYNKALSFAESGILKGICFANRSAVYLEVAMFHLCIENIQFARLYELSDRLKEKLDQRHELALAGLVTRHPHEPQRSYKLTLCRKPMTRQPFFIDCLAKFDDRVITKCRLKAGDAISLEKPYSQILRKTHIYERCTYCLSNRKYLSMIPCRLCTAAMFCNEECYSMAMRIFHCAECPIIDGLFFFLTDAMYLAVRTLFISMKNCNDGSMDQYRRLLMRCFENVTGSFEVDVLEDGRTFNEMVFLIIHNLNRSCKFSLQNHLATAVLIRKLKATFSGLFVDVDAALILSTSLFHLMQVSQESNVSLEEVSVLVSVWCECVRDDDRGLRW